MFDELQKLLDGNEDGLRLLDEAKTAQDALTTKLNVWEVDSKKAFEARDTTKQKAKKLLDRLGIDDLDNIDDAVLDKALSGKKVDDAELNNLKALIETANKEKGEMETSYKGQLSEYAFRTEIQKTGLIEKSLDANTTGILEALVMKVASYENGAIVIKNDDGSTKYINGKPMTLNDVVEELYNTPSYAGLFKADGKGGTGSNPGGGKGGNGTGTKKRSEMNHSEKAAYISEHGQDAYLKLP